MAVVVGLFTSLLSFCLETAEALVCEYWELVAAVAAALVGRKTLSSADVRAIADADRTE
jgi:hypothetical protein